MSIDIVSIPGVSKWLLLKIYVRALYHTYYH